MKLDRATVAKAYLEFGERYGWPIHADTDAKKSRIVDIDHRELAKLYSEERFPDALTIAWQQARRFPVVADFHRGFDAPKGGAAKHRGVAV